ncbi:ribosome small subunit-dependent GTPase A [Cytobacillus suaedae]|nr:ribosome small subunit-dependent GTPase A [Cytobacillus suaedae]
MNLQTLGWNEFFNNEFTKYTEQNYSVGRIALEHKRMYRIFTEEGDLLGEVSGKLRHNSISREDYPAVGDWVLISPRYEEGKATIHGILPRFSKFSRKVAGMTTEEQIVATNVNTLFLVNALNQDFNLRRIERYLLMAWESGANPVIVLTKSDLCNDIEEKLKQIETVALGVPVHAVSVKDDSGINQLDTYLVEGQTVALLGSSGAGKSTLTNRLIGVEKQLVKEIREGDDRGKHTTTHRELIVVPTGGIIIDTPGMRELQLWDAEDSLSHSFEDIETLAENCYYRDCTHGNEPQCAIVEAISDGSLDEERYKSYVKLQKELAYLERKNDKKAQLDERNKWKKLSGDRTRVHRK